MRITEIIGEIIGDRPRFMRITVTLMKNSKPGDSPLCCKAAKGFLLVFDLPAP